MAARELGRGEGRRVGWYDDKTFALSFRGESGREGGRGGSMYSHRG